VLSQPIKTSMKLMFAFGLQLLRCSGPCTLACSCCGALYCASLQLSLSCCAFCFKVNIFYAATLRLHCGQQLGFGKLVQAPYRWQYGQIRSTPDKYGGPALGNSVLIRSL
jgi:hypothetical protein